MKRVYVGQNATEIHMLVDLLKAEGIPAAARGFDSTWGTNPMVEPPSVWILHESDFAKAMRIVEEYSRGERAAYDAAAAWHCDQCGETVEGRFGECWNCGAPAPIPEPQDESTRAASPIEPVEQVEQEEPVPQKPARVVGLPLKLVLIFVVGLVLSLVRDLSSTVWIVYGAVALLVTVDHVLWRL